MTRVRVYPSIGDGVDFAKLKLDTVENIKHSPDNCEACKMPVTCLYTVGRMSCHFQKMLLTDLPNELKLRILLNLEPKDILHVSQINRMMYKFVSHFYKSVPREPLYKFVVYDNVANRNNDYNKRNLRLNLFKSVNETGQLWRTFVINATGLSNTFSSLDFAFRCQLIKNGSVELHNVLFTDDVFQTLKTIITEIVQKGYPNFHAKQAFTLRMEGCSFPSARKKSFYTFINDLINLGLTELFITYVKYIDFKYVCSELGKSNINHLEVFRFHCNEITVEHSYNVIKLFKPFFRLGRNTKKVVIDGFEIPLDTCIWIMTSFCCTPYYNLMPPELRVVMAIGKRTSREDLYDSLKLVRSDVNTARSLIRHRLNHVYLELGLYDSERHTSDLSHCVLDVNLLRHRKKLNELENSLTEA